MDSAFRVASLHPGDRWHEQARAARTALGPVRLLTSGLVLTEVLTYFSAKGSSMRPRAARFARETLADSAIHVLPQDRESLIAGIELYELRPDKDYRLVDCVSMQIMRDHGISEVLTHDHHFEQEGFVALLRG